MIANVTAKGLQVSLQDSKIGGVAIITAKDGQNLAQEVEDSKNSSSVHDKTSAWSSEV